MPGYIVVEIEVRDPQGYEGYKRMAEATVTQYGGRYLVRGGRCETLEGGWQPKRLVVLEFPSLERALAWYHSEAYREGKAVRLATATSRMVAVEGT